MQFVYNLSRLFFVMVIVITSDKEGHRKCNFPYPPTIKGYREYLDYGHYTGWVTVFSRFPAVQTSGGNAKTRWPAQRSV